jgi:hypothetical protein
MIITSNMTSFDDVENDDRPKTPMEEDCCGNACNPCIFDIHKKLLREWENGKYNKIKKYATNFLSLIQYKKFIVKDITEGSEDCLIIQLDCASGTFC